jgi:predicted CXXCH cytochrome family protein
MTEKWSVGLFGFKVLAVNFKQWFIAGIIATLAVSGCSPESRYRTLSFFFDGVPKPGEETVQVAGGKISRTSQKDAPGKIRPTTHGPYAAKMCDACHQRGGSNKLILPVEELCQNCHDLNIQRKHIHGPVASGGCRVCHEPHGSGRAYLLVSEPTTFCFYCHDEAEVGSREVHQASAGTQCTECHDPHSSDGDFMLK